MPSSSAINSLRNYTFPEKTNQANFPPLLGKLLACTKYHNNISQHPSRKKLKVAVNRLHACNERKAHGESPVCKARNLLAVEAILQSGRGNSYPARPTKILLKIHFHFGVVVRRTALSHAKLNYDKFPLKCDIVLHRAANSNRIFDARWRV